MADQTSWQQLPCPSNLGKLSPSQPMIVLAPPCPGPPLFVAYIKEEPLLFGMHQGYLILRMLKLGKNDNEYVLTTVRINRLVCFQFLL